MWHKGEIESLISEGKCIQNHLQRRIPPTDDDEIIARRFRDIMLRGKVRSALNYISQGKQVLVCFNWITSYLKQVTLAKLMQSTRDILNYKHQKGKVPPSSILLDGIAEPIDWILKHGGACARRSNQPQPVSALH